jgi:O-acetyl-ADP-ribose deacetylase (regulator of RNase III)
MISFHEQTDLFKFPADGFCHGVNCRGVAGGLAGEVFRRFPEMFEVYQTVCWSNGLRGGNVLPFRYEIDGRRFVVYNLASQVEPGANADLGLLESACRLMLAHAQANGVGSVNCPQIGAGIGGLGWSDVRDVLVRVFEPVEDFCLQVVTRSTFG